MRRSLIISTVAATLVALPVLRADSLWSAGASDRSMFADRKAAKTGDIVTIVISESIAAQSSQSKKSDRDSSIADAVGSFFFPTIGLHNGSAPALNISAKASYKGGGDVNNNQSLDSRAAAMVTDVLPNGNLVIEGVRVVTFSGETQYVVLHGLVRADDVSAGNTVQSSNIAEARVEFISEGTLTDAQKRGWLTKLYEKLRLF